VLAAAERLAGELSTTSNDAIVRLAEEGAAARERRARTAAIAAARRNAVEQAGGANALPFPAPAEVREAMLSGRKLG
jgi:hypothetical protein